MSSEAPRSAVIGLLADPDLPANLPVHLGQALPSFLSDVDPERSWRVDMEVIPLAGGEQQEATTLLKAAGEMLRQRDWDMVIVLTDLPRRAGTRAVVADLSPDDGAALASVPALGAIRLRQRALAVVAHLVLVLAGTTEGRRPGAWHLRALARETGEGGDRLVLPSRLGRWRLLAGMVRANRPWRLVTGLSGALLAAFAGSAVSLLTPTLWQLAAELSGGRLVLVTAVSIAAMVVYLILQHELWERLADAGSPRLARLYNVTTAATVTLGVAIFYLVLLALMAVLVPFFLTHDILAQNIGHPPTFRDYAHIIWLIASVAVVSSALGSGTEDDESVRRAAYGYRHRVRAEEEAALRSAGSSRSTDP
ncbi:MAG: hypothetical protein JWP40_2232 [Blastococcus sp.]|jgi:hypothetical protein|nr:hypothetical protein [Blastococcus sp.]